MSSFLIRPSFPDELSRIQSILGGAPVATDSRYLVVVKEMPVERILAVLAWWPVMPADNTGDGATAFFTLGTAGALELDDEMLDGLIDGLEAAASDAGVVALRLQTPLPEDNPMFKELIRRRFFIDGSDRHFLVPGDVFKNRSTHVFQKVRKRIPSNWQVGSIKGHSKEEIFAVVAEHNLMPAYQFDFYWDAMNRERFEEDVSSVLVEDGDVIGVFLLTRRSDNELHVHVESVTAGRMAQSALASAAMRHHMASQCPEGFPAEFSWRADAKEHEQTANTALRQGGRELQRQHLLCKEL